VNAAADAPPVPLLSLDQPLYSIDETVALLRISRRTLYRHIQAKDLATVKLGRRTVIRRDDLEALLDRWAEEGEGLHR